MTPPSKNILSLTLNPKHLPPLKTSAMSQRKLILSMQITLDGYVAGPNDELDWLIISDDVWTDLDKDLNAADTYLLGRKMYPHYAEHWQSVLRNRESDPNELKFAKLAEKTQHIVFTKGDFKPNWKNTRVAHDLPAEVARLKKEKGKNILAWGGANFASNLIKLGLVDEYRLALNPTILTRGKALFNNLEQRKKLALIDSKPLKSGLVSLRYQSDAGDQKAEARVKSLQSEIH
jgi:dihydrofolate reductase